MVANKYEIVCITDSNSELWGWSLDGYTIVQPTDISKYDYDALIIDTSEFAEPIEKDLVTKYKVDKDKIVVFESREKGIEWAEERVIMARKCMQVIKERGVDGETAELGVWKGDFSRIINLYLLEKIISI